MKYYKKWLIPIWLGVINQAPKNEEQHLKSYKVLDLFSGIGGFSLGLERAGMETIGFCEIDKHCQKIFGPDGGIRDNGSKESGERNCLFKRWLI